MLARFNGNVVPFADDATSTNRTVFGGTTQSDTLDDNLNADFKKGWEIVGLNDNPTREDFNAMGYTLGALTAYLYEMGISEWNASQNYRIGSRVIGSDRKIYKALTGTTGTPNVNNNPTSDTVNWEWELKTITDYSALTAKTTPVDADLLALGDSASLFSLKKLTWANLKTVLFGSPALTGTPTAPTQTAQDNSTKIATTAYVDGKMVRGTVVNSTSGTSIDFTGIPSWTKRITVMFNGVSTSGIAGPLVQLGTAGGIVTSGYTSVGARLINASAADIATSTIGFIVDSPLSTNVLRGNFTLNLLTGNLWTCNHILASTAGQIATFTGAGDVTLSGVLDRVRITTANGTDTFDAGQINIMYEG